MNRWWIYQAERFPLLRHGPLIAAFSFSAVSYSALLRGGTPGVSASVVAFVVCFLTFLQLRISDEFKDAEKDARYRPYRAVPRGLVRLPELGIVWALAILIQGVVVAAFDVRLLPLLGVTWAYLGLMSVEFFARDWLEARPITYLWTHMLIMPLVDLFATAADWLPHGGMPHPALIVFLVCSFLNGLTLELGRKIRPAEDEEEGVETYSALWGSRKAAWVWFGSVLLLCGGGICASIAIDFEVGTAAILGTYAFACWFVAYRFARNPSSRGAAKIETFSGIGTLSLYGSLGVLPLFLR